MLPTSLLLERDLEPGAQLEESTNRSLMEGVMNLRGLSEAPLAAVIVVFSANEERGLTVSEEWINYAEGAEGRKEEGGFFWCNNELHLPK